MKYVEYTNEDKSMWQQRLIDCYKQVFAAPPWNEEWWTNELVQEVLDQYAGPNAKIILSVEKDQVTGFAWGACWKSCELSQELNLELPFLPQQEVAYIKDVGVVENCRKAGIARALLRELTTTISAHCDSQSMLLARTLASPEPSVVYHWFPKVGFSTIARYSDQSERVGQVILGAPISDVSF